MRVDKSSFGLVPVLFLVAGCSAGNSPSSTTGGSSNATGGAAHTGGTTSSNGGSTSTTTGGTTTSNGGSTTTTGGAGGTSATTGGTTTSNGGSTTTTGGAGGTSATTGGTTTVGGSASTGGTTTVGGTSSATGGAAGMAATAGLGNRACAPKSVDVISDFEENSAVLIPQGTPVRNGWWYVYADTVGGATQTPAAAMKAVAVAPSGSTEMCDKYSFHSTSAGHNMYVGFGAAFLPDQTGATQMKQAYDLSQYDGVSFRIKSGGGTPPAIYFEMLTKESQPAASGGTATTDTIDLYNTRGQMLNSGSMNIGTSWTTVYVPFATLIPRWVPAVGSGKACPAAGGAVPKCQATKWVPTNALGLQFSFYPDPGFPKLGTLGTYDIWVDDVTLYKRSASTPDLPAPPAGGGSKPFPQNAVVPNCAKPAGPAVDGKFLVPAYNAWKAKFVVAAGSGFRVQRPEENNDSVSEGIAYGMLIAVYMNDKTLFDGLWTYWKANSATSDGPLMNWKVPGGNGTATDADEDAAFAMLVASKQWSGGTYAADAQSLMNAVLAHDMSGSYIKGGSNYSASDPTNPSYFAPAWYKAFAAANTANATAWNNLYNGVYTLLNSISGTSSTGLYAAWCGSNCTTIATNSGSANPATDVLYQYDSHRIPFRIGMDACWNNNASAKAYVAKTSAFFANTAGKDGVGRIFDIYTPSNGREATGAAVNSASILGTAAVGAMAGGTTYKAFLDDSYQAVFDLTTRASLAELGDGTKSAYSYYNATVGMLSLLMLTGNMTPP